MENRKPSAGVLYCRVSDPKQVEGTSLASQERQGREFMAQKKIAVHEVFVDEGQSAKTADRTQFMRALSYCRANQGKIGYFVVWKLDRFARNAEDHFIVRQQLQRLRITLLSVTEPIGDSPSEKFLETMLAASAEFDNAVRKQRCIDGMSERINQGIYPWKPPIGYLPQGTRARGEKKREPDRIDPVVYPMIQKALRAYLTGTNTQTDIVELLMRQGLDAHRGVKTRHQLVDRILGKNLRFYAGLLYNPWTGKTVGGKHRAMITVDEMHEIARIRNGKRPAIKRTRRSDDFKLRRTIKCGACESYLTGGASKGRSARYFYYHCFNESCPSYRQSLRRDDVEEQFTEFLLRITPKSDALRDLTKRIQEEWARQASSVLTRDEKLESRVRALEEQRTRVFEAFERGDYSREDFRDRCDSVDAKISELRGQQSYGDGTIANAEEALDFASGIIKDLPSTWRSLPSKRWSRFEKIIFPEGVTYDRNSGFRTEKLSAVYAENGESCRHDSPEVGHVGVHSNHSTIQEELRQWAALLQEEQVTERQ